MQTRFAGGMSALARGLSPVTAIVLGELLIILGVLTILYPALLYWMVGIGLILGGVALVASVLAPPRSM
jgi:uncharacterized membrane protein HdeD (DUF308 family)